MKTAIRCLLLLPFAAAGAGDTFTAKDYDIAVPAIMEWFAKHLSPKSAP